MIRQDFTTINSKKSPLPKPKKKAKKSFYAMQSLNPPPDTQTHPPNRAEGCDNIYILKTHHADDSIYEFPAKMSCVNEIRTFILSRNERRNAMCDVTSDELFVTLGEYMKQKAMNEWNFR